MGPIVSSPLVTRTRSCRGDCLLHMCFCSDEAVTILGSLLGGADPLLVYLRGLSLTAAGMLVGRSSPWPSLL